MYVLNYWHNVPDYAEWKKVFDSDPLGREASGIRRFSIERPIGDEHRVVGHLEFDTLGEAESFGARLQEVWDGLGESVVSDTGQTISEIMEAQEFRRDTARKVA